MVHYRETFIEKTDLFAVAMTGTRGHDVDYTNIAVSFTINPRLQKNVFVGVLFCLTMPCMYLSVRNRLENKS